MLTKLNNLVGSIVQYKDIKGECIKINEENRFNPIVYFKDRNNNEYSALFNEIKEIYYDKYKDYKIKECSGLYMCYLMYKYYEKIFNKITKV